MGSGRIEFHKNYHDQILGLAFSELRDLVESNFLATGDWGGRAPGNCGLDQHHHCQPDAARGGHNTATFTKGFRQHDLLPRLRRTADHLFSRNVRAIQER